MTSSLVSNLTAVGLQVPYPKAPQVFLITGTVVAATGLLICIVHMVIVTSMPKVNHVADKNFKFFSIYLSTMNGVIMSVHLATENEQTQRLLFERHWLCILSATVAHSSMSFVGWMLILVTVDRLIAMFFAHRYAHNKFVSNFAFALLGTHLTVGLCYIILAVLLRDTAYSSKGSGFCELKSENMPNLDLVIVGQAGFILSGIVLGNAALIFGNRSHAKQLKPVDSTSRQKNHRDQRRRLITIISALVASKILCWVPAILAIILRGTRFENPNGDYISRILLMFTAHITPLVYGLTSTKYRQFAKTLLLRYCRVPVSAVHAHVDQTSRVIEISV